MIAAFISTLSLIPTFIDAYKPWKGLIEAEERILVRIMRTYGKWELVSPLANKGTSFLSTWLIKILISTEAVAIFNVAKSMVALVKGFMPISPLSTLIALSLDDKERIRKAIIYGTKYLVVFSFVAGAAALIYIPPLVGIFFPQYQTALPLFSFMLLHMVFISLGSVAGIYLHVLRKQKFLFIHRLMSDGLVVLLYVVFIPFLGIWGLAFEYVLNPLIMLFVTIWYFIVIKPGITIQWREIFSFGKEDAEFIRIVYREGIVVMGRRVRKALRFQLKNI